MTRPVASVPELTGELEQLHAVQAWQVRAMSEQLNDLTSENQNLRSQYRLLETTQQEQEREQDDLRKEMAALLQQHEARDKRRGKVAKELKRVEEENERLQETSKDTQKQIAQLQDTVRKGNLRIGSLEKHLKQLKAEKEALVKTNDKLEGDLVQVSSEKARLLRSIGGTAQSDAARLIDHLQEKVDELETAAARRSSGCDDGGCGRAANGDFVGQLEDDNARLKEEISIMRQALERALDQLRLHKEEASKPQDNEEMDESAAVLVADLHSEVERQRCEVQAKNQTILELQAKLRAVMTVPEEVSPEIQTQWTAEVAAAEADTRHAQENLARVAGERDRFSQEVQELRREVERLRDSAASSPTPAAQAALESVLERTKAELSMVRRLHAESVAKEVHSRAALEADLHQLSAHCNEMERQLKEARQENEALQQSRERRRGAQRELLATVREDEEEQDEGAAADRGA